MKNTVFSLDITIDRFLTTTPNLGAVTLQREGREYILDVCQSYTYDDDDCQSGTTIQCEFSPDEDKETFPDCPFDLTIEDMLSEDLLALFFIDSEDEEFEVDRMILSFTVNGERKSIPVLDEMRYESSKVTAADVLNWHGSDHGINELAETLASIVNGEYNPELCKQEILNSK